MEIDYDKPITRSCLDLEAYNKKFEFADSVLNDNVKDSKAYTKLFTDPTLFAYALFKDNHGNRLKLYPYQDAILNDMHRYRYFRAANQVGKEQPVSALVLTPEGYSRIGDVKVGDILYGGNGEPCMVLEVFPQGVKLVYRLEFSDGSIAECGYDHLWKVQLPKNRFISNFNGLYKRNKDSELGKWDIVPLKYLIERFGCDPSPPNRCIIPVTEPITMPRQQLPIHPYIVGVMLGDGSMSQSYGSEITSADSDIILNIRKYLPDGIRLNKKKSKYKYCFNSNKKHIWSKLFKRAGLKMCKSEHKKIPDKYLYSDYTQRLFLLCGLMDADGCISDKSTVEFYSKSIHLAEGVRFLVNSFGGKAKIVKKDAKYRDKEGNYVDCGICYRVRIYMNKLNPFMLPRKANRHYETRYRKERVLRKIRFDRYEESVCLYVDSPDNTYLTNECIVTHNSLLFNVKAARNLVIDHGHGHNEAIVSKSLPQSIDQMRRIQTLLNTARFTWKEETGLTKSMSVITIDIKDEKGQFRYTNKLICAPCTEGLLGYDLHDLNLDEFEFWDIDLEYFFKQIAQPRTYTTKGNIMVMTNPNGQDNFGAKLEQEIIQKTGKKKWHVYVFNYLDKPGNTQEEYDQLKYELTRATFESTVDAVRTTSDRAYFSPDEIEHSYDPVLERNKDTAAVGKYTFWFLDVGTKHDQSVLTGCFVEPDLNNDRLNHVHIFCIHKYPVGYPLYRVAGSTAHMTETDGWHYEKSVREYLEEYSMAGQKPVFGYDATSNKAMSDLFLTMGIDAVDIVFSGVMKSAYYQRFKWYMEKKLLHRIKDDDWARQASWLYAERSARGYLMIHNINHFQKKGKFRGVKVKEDLDDCMDSTAGLIQLASPIEVIEPSMMVI